MKWKNCLVVCLSILLIGFLGSPHAEALTEHPIHPTLRVQDVFSLYDRMMQGIVVDGRVAYAGIHGDVTPLKEDGSGNRTYFRLDLAMNRNMMVVANRQGQVMKVFIEYPKSEGTYFMMGMRTLGALVLTNQPLTQNETLLGQDLKKMAVALKQLRQSKIGIYDSIVSGRPYYFFWELQGKRIVGWIASLSR